MVISERVISNGRLPLGAGERSLPPRKKITHFSEESYGVRMTLSNDSHSERLPLCSERFPLDSSRDSLVLWGRSQLAWDRVIWLQLHPKRREIRSHAVQLLYALSDTGDTRFYTNVSVTNIQLVFQCSFRQCAASVTIFQIL